MFATSLRFYDIVVFLHIAAVVTAFGVTFVYPLIVPLTTRSAPDKLPWLQRMQDEIGKKIITPSATVVLIAGLYLALSGDGPFDLKDWWVGFGLLAILVILGLGALSLVAGYLLLSSGSTTPASILLVLGYCVLVPVGLAL